MNKQNEKVEAQNTRIEKISQKLNSMYYYDDSENLGPDSCIETGDYSQEIPVCEVEEPPVKRSRTVDGSVFKTLTEKFQSTESLDAEVNENLASFVNNAFHNGISEEKQNDMLKNIHRPVNCDRLVKIRVNQGI